jgi:signal-transduction protein with cAMP-binding, CBS, and nucleotidyltransferase domain
LPERRDERPYSWGGATPTIAKMSDSRVPGGLSTTLGSLDLDPLTVVSETDSLEFVASTFLNRGTSCAILDEQPLRVVTERDLAAAWAQGRSARDHVGLISSDNPYWTPVEATVAEAASFMMRLGVRHLVVLDVEGRPTGVVSMIELFSILVHSQEPLAIYASFASFMTRATGE